MARRAPAPCSPEQPTKSTTARARQLYEVRSACTSSQTGDVSLHAPILGCAYQAGMTPQARELMWTAAWPFSDITCAASTSVARSPRLSAEGMERGSALKPRRSPSRERRWSGEPRSPRIGDGRGRGACSLRPPGERPERPRIGSRPRTRSGSPIRTRLRKQFQRLALTNSYKTAH